ncbi:CoA ester lyase [Intrasporangium calvum]|uniref:CoA ester lyase n=1 Tax=Intrasporangium calvum TaxID=53358 RepID=A0ABT5GKK0_9MICO|nr:CoA ester lyase [Intrasporangium calvum]MDC5698753.1 CoA ester lyase [Intrasporangium calvum]
MTATHDVAVRHVQEARSLLFVPGDRPDRFDKAGAAGADLVIIDLEDAVAPGRRPGAREAATEWLASGGTAAVRVNAVGTADHDLDVAALTKLVAGHPDQHALLAVVVAKAEGSADLSGLAHRVGAPVVPLLETARGVQRAAELAEAQGVARLAFGHLDYALDLGAAPTRQAMLHARSMLVQASRAAGLPGPVDGVTAELDDFDRLVDDVAHGVELGFTGKLLIHPRQVEPTHAAYRPTSEEVAWAERVIAAVEAATGGRGALRVDGAMVDRPVIVRAETTLRRRDQ